MDFFVPVNENFSNRARNNLLMTINSTLSQMSTEKSFLSPLIFPLSPLKACNVMCCDQRSRQREKGETTPSFSLLWHFSKFIRWLSRDLAKEFETTQWILFAFPVSGAPKVSISEDDWFSVPLSAWLRGSFFHFWWPEWINHDIYGRSIEKAVRDCCFLAFASWKSYRSKDFSIWGAKKMCSALKFLPHSLCVQMWKLFRHPEMENVLRIYFLSTLELNRTIDARLNPRNRFDIAQRQARLELNQYTKK